jgi:splicing factor U2AF subunit
LYRYASGQGGGGGGGGGSNVPPEDQGNRLFIGGLPYFLTEPMVRELVEAFGPVKSFQLVVDRDTGNSKGYGFFVYQDQSVTDVVGLYKSNLVYPQLGGCTS